VQVTPTFCLFHHGVCLLLQPFSIVHKGNIGLQMSPTQTDKAIQNGGCFSPILYHFQASGDGNTQRVKCVVSVGELGTLLEAKSMCKIWTNFGEKNTGPPNCELIFISICNNTTKVLALIWIFLKQERGRQYPTTKSVSPGSLWRLLT